MGLARGPVGGNPALFSIKLGGENTADEEVFGEAARILNRHIDEVSPVLIAIEEPFYKAGESNYGTTRLLHGLYGALVGIARLRGVIVWPVAVATWRRAVLGTAKFSSRQGAKNAAMTFCKGNGWHACDDNAAEAGCIFHWAATKYAPFGVLPANALEHVAPW